MLQDSSGVELPWNSLGVGPQNLFGVENPPGAGRLQDLLGVEGSQDLSGVEPPQSLFGIELQNSSGVENLLGVEPPHDSFGIDSP